MELIHTFRENAASVTVAILSAAALASLAGSILFIGGLFVLNGTAGLEEVLVAPFAVLGLTFVAFFITFPALIAVGLPLAFLLRDFAHARWMMAFAVLAGALAGFLIAKFILRDMIEASVVYGTTAGFFWQKFASSSPLVSSGVSE